MTILQEVIRDLELAALCLHDSLWRRLLVEVALYRVPQRPPRCYPRVVKRKMSNFPLKREG